METVTQNQPIRISKEDRSRLAISVLRAKMNKVKPSTCPLHGACDYFSRLVIDEGIVSDGKLDYQLNICLGHYQGCEGFSA